MASLNIKEAWHDLLRVIENRELVLHLSFSEIRRRYRRTLLGPLWASLNLLIFLCTLGLLYTHLWHIDLKEYFPYLTVGLLIWNPMSTAIVESSSVFVSASGILSQIKIPYMVFVFNLLVRNFILFFHMLFIYIGVVIIFSVPVNANTWLCIPALLLLFINGIWLTTVIGMICARYRDFQQLVTNLLQIAFFVTPILWMSNQLGERGIGKILIGINPLYHLVDIVRKPMLGMQPDPTSWYLAIALGILGNIMVFLFFARYRKKIIFWL